MEIFHFLPTRQVNSHAYDITANTPIGKKEKNVFKIFANTKIIDFNHTCRSENYIEITNSQL
jgi:hypothetical protein